MTVFRRLITALLTLFMLSSVTAGYCACQPSIVDESTPTLAEKEGVFTPEKLHLVDHNPQSGNYLFRGNMPIANGCFVYRELVDTMNQRAIEKLEAALPAEIYIIDISLISKLHESHLLRQEQVFAHDNPDLLYLVHRPVYGAISNPDHYSGSTLHMLLNLPLIHRVNRLVDQLRHRLDQKGNHPMALYVHCQAGSDRTGMVIGAYQMQFLGKSYREVIEEAEAIAGRRILSAQKRGLKWIAYYLRDRLGIDSIGDID